MATQLKSLELVRFADFEFDCQNGELRRNGTCLKLQPQPAKILAVLVQRAGQVVTRQELAEQVWGSETFVDFEQGLNYAIRQIRTVLEDDADQPRFLETLPKRGYRFVAPVTNGLHEKESATVIGASGPRKVRLRLGLALLIATGIAGAVIFETDAGHLRQRWLGRAGGHRIRSLAVLPLHNLSHDPDQEYFSDGMTDELITDLAKLRGLRVISHTSVERYKGTKRPLPEIARELGADAVVEGTVMRSGNRVRITVQLIDAPSDRHMWAESYERDLHDALALQDEVAQRIATEVGINVAAIEPRPASTRVVDPAAHEAYLRGNFYWNQLSCDGFAKGREYFQQAIAKDPNFAPAYVGLSQSYFTLADWGCSSDPELVFQSKAAALKALELDPDSGNAHAWLGKLAFFYEWDFPKAENELKRAIELSPNDAPAHIVYAVFLVTVGRPEPGLLEMQRAHDLDPTSQLTNLIGIFVFYLDRHYDAAIEQGKKTVELYPASSGAYDWLGAAYEKRGLYDQANAAYVKAKELQGASPKELAAFRSAYQRSGIRGFWERELETAQSGSSVDPCWIMRIYAHLGDRERTLDFLNRSFQQHCSGPHTVIADPINDRFRDDPKFKDLIVRLGLSQN